MKILVVFGTRPEAIKLFPVIHALKQDSRFSVVVCVTAQHRQMLDQVLQVAKIYPDVDLDVMRPGQTLPEVTTRILSTLDDVLEQVQPDRVLVQGDTTTAMAAALAAYYRQIPVDHVEAGLRSQNIYSPWPEEVNRKIVSNIASLHFAPTPRAATTLIEETIPAERVVVTGNTVIDALLDIQSRIDEFQVERRNIDNQLPDDGDTRRIILTTAHRRENFDGGMERIARALRQLASRDDVLVVLPVHPNPNVQRPMRELLHGHPNIRLLEPLEYVPFVYLLSRAYLVLTDSGGIQEEAPALGKPVLVMRDTTERPEGIEAGTAILVGTDAKRITAEATRLLHDQSRYEAMSLTHNPFGDGRASHRILEAIAKEARLSSEQEKEMLRYAS